MHLEVKTPENGRKNIFRDNQNTNKVQLMFFNVRVFIEKWQLHFSTLSTNKEGTMYVFSV